MSCPDVLILKEPQEVCPNKKCGSDNISNEGPPEDGVLFVTCHDCSTQWHEPYVEPKESNS